ncbi:glycoside hydrolase [Lentinula aciculospora]|uniref:Glycoside hydrolase n=1 Tax=Lentinula aciculospora TaxID=153920 RepID=A0A9W9DEZ7_9AGAR|nr:glycoside hydrolase [Lentinula aciculospora]
MRLLPPLRAIRCLFLTQHVRKRTVLVKQLWRKSVLLFGSVSSSGLRKVLKRVDNVSLGRPLVVARFSLNQNALFNMVPQSKLIPTCKLALLSLWAFIPRYVHCQQIYDVWQTTWDRSTLFTPLPRTTSTAINFTPSTRSIPTSVNIVVDDTVKFQDIVGFGGSLTDSAALTLKNLKTANSGNYWNLLNYMFNPTDGVDAAGLSYVRVPIGASDFSTSVYSLDDTQGDTSFNSFNINCTPAYAFEVLKDIQSINDLLKVHILPWSPPSWMKVTGTMNGGSIRPDMVTFYPAYLLKAVESFQGMGIPIYAVSIQNEPQNSNPTYPTCTIAPDVEAQIGSALRSLLNGNGLSSVKIIGYEHNWDDAGAYPVTLIRDAPDTFAGVAFHCYEGNVANQDAFHNADPSKDIYLTECSGTLGSDWWGDIKWYMDNLWIGALEHNAKSGLMWNIALDGNGNPMLSGANSCNGGGCRALVTVNSDGSYSFNQEFYSMAHASKAIIPKDPRGLFGTRIQVSVTGSLGWTLRVGAYVTQRNNPSDWSRYSIVVLNWYDSPSGSWSPTPITASISFRGMQATYTFPVGVSTLWWYAPPTS